MEWDDVVYVSLLILSIVLGHYFKRISDKTIKKWAATVIGIVLVVIVSGKHTLHPLICTFVNALIITFGNKKTCHLASFVFQFVYLLFFRTTIYFGIEYAPAHTNLVQMMLTLKLVGLAFEVHDSAKAKSSDTKSDPEQEALTVNPSFLDVFHYAFCYVGVLTGPYHRYRTYLDWLETPFAFYAPCKDATIQKIKYIPLYAGLFLLASYLFPLSYAESNEFYEESSIWFRIWYITPSFFIFRMRMYTGLTLSECVCTMAGLGAYPIATEPKPGQGPSKNYELLNRIASNSELAKEEGYDFESIHNINPYGSDFVTTFREAIKCWNSCIQYWLVVYVHKRVPFKKYRAMFTMFISAYWHGVYAGYYLCICSAPLYMPIEDIYVKLYLKEATGLSRKIWEWILWFFKMQAFSYMAIAFLLLRIDKTWYFWKSIYFTGHLLGITFYIVGILILKNRKKKSKSE